MAASGLPDEVADVAGGRQGEAGLELQGAAALGGEALSAQHLAVVGGRLQIEGEAAGGEVLASDVVRQLAAGKGFLFSSRGRTALRGFDDPVEVYEVRWQEEG